MVICGGYRRGKGKKLTEATATPTVAATGHDAKEESSDDDDDPDASPRQSGCGDVDILLSHRDPSRTSHFIEDLVSALEDAGLVTHTLSLSTRNSERGQTPLPWKGSSSASSSGGPASSSTGFDTLDKALVVWQEPEPEDGNTSSDMIDFSSSSSGKGKEMGTKTAAAARKTKTKKKKNPNPHRRVDIVVTPWRTAGCAVAGWTGATTFERDLRRYCKEVLDLKFDSSGVRRIGGGGGAGGEWVDLESGEGDGGGVATSMEEAERRVFRGLGLEWREPGERCTG